METNQCEHKEIYITEGYRENHSCWYEDYPSYAECANCGFTVSDKYSYKQYKDFIKDKKVVSCRSLKHEINIP